MQNYLVREPYKRLSSPARGTWIEIFMPKNAGNKAEVVPRKGDVDRNKAPQRCSLQSVQVVPRKGDVDRNKRSTNKQQNNQRRPPQGGCG